MLHWIASLALSEAGRRDKVRVRRGSRAGGGGVCLGEVGGVSDPVGRAVGHGRAPRLLFIGRGKRPSHFQRQEGVCLSECDSQE